MPTKTKTSNPVEATTSTTASAGPQVDRTALTDAYRRAQAELKGTDTPTVAAVAPAPEVEASQAVAPPTDPAASEPPAVTEPAETPIAYADPDTLKDQVFRITVDGEPVEVTYEELSKGYSRQADYSRKTAALASEREELKAVAEFKAQVEDNPLEAIQALATALNYDLLPDGKGQVINRKAPQSGDGLGFDRYEPGTEPSTEKPSSEIAELRSGLAELKAAQAKAEQDRVLQSSLAEAKSLVQQYNVTSITPAEVVQHQVKHQIPSVEIAVKDLAWDLAQERAAEKARAESNAKRAQATKKVASGGSVAAGSIPAKPAQIKTPRDALLAAKEELGIADISGAFAFS